MHLSKLHIIFEISVVIFEMFTLSIYHRSFFTKKTASAKRSIAAYGIFGIVLSLFCILWPNMLVLSTVTLLGVFIVSAFVYKAKLLLKIFSTVLYLIIVVIMEAAVPVILSVTVNVSLEEMGVHSGARIFATVCAKLMIFLIIKVLSVFLQRHRMYAYSGLSRIVPLIICQAALLIIVSSSFITTYQGDDSMNVFFLLSVLGAFFTNIIIFWYFDLFMSTADLTYQNEIASMQIRNQIKYYHAVQARYEKVAAIEHDTKKHYIALQGYLSGNDISNAKNYLSSLLEAADGHPAVVFSPNLVVNAILSDCLARTKDMGFTPSINIDIKDNIGISDTDLTVILGNSIDNALEALSEVSDAERRLSVSLKQRNGFVHYAVINSHAEKAKRKEKNRRGYGLMNIRAAVEKYGGDLLQETDGQQFSLTIIFQN